MLSQVKSMSVASSLPSTEPALSAGAEGMVFAPGLSDFSWIRRAQAVSLEIHDYFGPYFGLQVT